MKPVQRQLLADMAEAAGAGAELLRSFGDVAGDSVRDLRQIADGLRDNPAAFGPEKLGEVIGGVIAPFTNLAAELDRSADRFAEMAAQLLPYRRGGKAL